MNKAVRNVFVQALSVNTDFVSVGLITESGLLGCRTYVFLALYETSK